MRAPVPRTPGTVRAAALALRVQQLTAEVERLFVEAQVLTKRGELEAGLLAEPARSLQRAAAALAAVASSGSGERSRELKAVLEGTSALMSAIGSRVVLSGVSAGPAAAPSAGARALAMLLEAPDREFDAAEVASRLEVSVPAARTTLNRLVKSGHARRRGVGRFGAKG
jgi:hypothetical protein